MSRIPFNEIQSVSADSVLMGALHERAMVVKKNDHLRYSFIIVGRVLLDGNQSEAAAALLQKLLEDSRNSREAGVTTRPPPAFQAP